MSLKKTHLLSLLLVIIGGLVAGGVFSQKKERAPASFAPVGKSDLFRARQLRMAKPNQVIQVSINPVGGFPATNDEQVTLRARVSVTRDMSALSYRWNLPTGAALVSGLQQGVIQIPDSGESAVLEIVVVGFSSEGHRRNITLDVNGYQMNTLLGATGVVNSHPTQKDLSYKFRSTQEPDREDQAQQKMQGSEDNQPDLVIPKGVKL